MSQEVHTRLRVSAVLIALFAVIGIVFAGAPAWAHDELIGSDPATGARVDALPAEITMTFSGVLMDEPGATDVVVTDAAGTDLTSGDPVIDGTRLTQQLSGSAAGEVTVIWRVVSSDGHPVSDQFTFSVAGDAAVAPTGSAPSPTAAAPADPDMAGTDVTGWLWGGALVAVLAAGVIVFVVVERKTRSRPSSRD